MKKIKIGKLKISKNKSKAKNPEQKKNIKSIILSGLLVIGIAVISLILVFALYIIITSPDFDRDKLYSKESTVLYYSDGVTELARLGAEDRVLVTYDELPQVLVDAIVATEDSRFFQHKGMDVARFLKASFGQLMGNSEAGGASTITMQLVKQVYTNSEDQGLAGIIRKFTDIYMAVFKVESNYTKEEIIEFYVNTMWFAGSSSINNTGIYGVEQACQYYFGKSVSDLTLAEASIIAGMFQNPYRYNPYTNPEGVRNRQEIVLTLMVNHGYITESEKEAVLDIPIESLVTTKESSNGSNQAVIDYIVNDITAKTGMDPRNTPMEVVTTINKDVQNVLNQLETGELYEFPNETIQEGMAITSTVDGSIVALSGGRNYAARGLNRAEERRQPGSTAKPIFDYGPYIEYLNGSPASLFLDNETTYSNGTSIKNSDGRYMGLITMRTALIESRNIPALKAFQAVYAENPDYISDFVHGLGIDYGDTLLESMSIGGFEGISPIEMSAAYGTFGRGGYYIEPYTFTKITVSESGEIIEHKYEKVRVMSEETAYLITDILVSAAENGVGGVQVSGTTIAAKSGTSNVDRTWAESHNVPTSATRDAWNVTYSPEYAIALWIGYDSTSSENYLTVSVGNRVRSAVMKAVGSRVYSQNQKFTVPDGIIAVEIEKETFPTQLASEFTPSNLRTTELFKEGTEPTEESIRFAKLEVPTNGNYTFDGTTLRLTWNAIATPDAINTSYLQNYFNTYYDNHANSYYEKRLNYNYSYIGTLGYQIYKKESNGTLTYIGRTESNNYSFTPNDSGNVTYVIRSAYSIFTANMSDNLEINVNLGMDSNMDDIINSDPSENNPSTPGNGNNSDNTSGSAGNNRPNTGLE